MPMLDRFSGVMRTVAAVAVVALLAAMVIVMWPSEDKKYLTATFPRTIALYEGSEVKILGVPVGKVESVDPQGTQVKVRLWYDAATDVPADAKAVIISPSVVGDRFVQLTPAYNGGPTLPDEATLGQDRTAEPLELDQIYQSLNDLNVALGPKGANKNGSLSRLLNATAKNFDGQGKQFHQTITDLSRFTGTLDNNKEEMFASLRQLARFTAVLRENDQNVRSFNRNLAQMSEFLEGERDDLAGALSNLGRAMDDITTFVRSNRRLIKENVNGLTEISGVLVKQREALKEIMDVAPLALNNLAVAYNPLTGTLDQRSNFGENVAQLEHDPALFLCTLVNEADDSGRACGAIQDAVGALDGLPRPRSSPFGARGSDRAVDVERVDKTLGGILDGGDR
ncbi:MAG TPA: MCE family protein [Nocardioidaceae bacterium]|nr:MCE family protein [Nocardioidaceae bacterium]